MAAKLFTLLAFAALIKAQEINLCSGDNDNHCYIDSNDCGCWWQCQGPFPVLQCCQDGYYYDEFNLAPGETCGQCVRQEEVNCVQCPGKGVKWAKFKDSCYHFSSELDKITWMDAVYRCDDLDSVPVEISSEEEQLFLDSYFYSYVADDSTFHPDFWWFGGTNQDSAFWYWYRSRDNITYDNWALGEPRPFGHCMLAKRYQHSHIEYQWSSAPCETSAAYVCEGIYG